MRLLLGFELQTKKDNIHATMPCCFRHDRMFYTPTNKQTNPTTIAHAHLLNGFSTECHSPCTPVGRRGGASEGKG